MKIFDSIWNKPGLWFSVVSVFLLFSGSILGEFNKYLRARACDCILTGRDTGLLTVPYGADRHYQLFVDLLKKDYAFEFAVSSFFVNSGLFLLFFGCLLLFRFVWLMVTKGLKNTPQRTLFSVILVFCSWGVFDLYRNTIVKTHGVMAIMSTSGDVYTGFFDSLARSMDGLKITRRERSFSYYFFDDSNAVNSDVSRRIGLESDYKFIVENYGDVSAEKKRSILLNILAKKG